MFKDWSHAKRQHTCFQGSLWALNCHWLLIAYQTKHGVFSTTLENSLNLAEVCLSRPFPFLSPVTSRVSHSSPVLFPEGALAFPSLIYSFGSLCLKCPSSPNGNPTHASQFCSQLPSWGSWSLTLSGSNLSLFQDPSTVCLLLFCDVHHILLLLALFEPQYLSYEMTNLTLLIFKDFLQYLV